MKPNTALGLIALGFSLWALTPERPKLWRVEAGVASALITAMIGAITAFEYVAHVDLGIDQILFPADPGTLPILYPARMSPVASLEFMMAGTALLTLNFRIPTFQILAVVMNGIATLALLSFHSGANSAYSFKPFASLAIHTAFAFWLASLAILAARPDRGFMRIVISQTAGGYSMRKLLLILPVSLFLIHYVAEFGLQADWYDAPFALAVSGVMGMCTSALLIFFESISLYKTDLARAQAESEVIGLNRGLEETVRRRTEELRRALDQVKQLKGLLPICAWCNKIRGQQDSWKTVEEYISENTEATFTHSICPDCLARESAKL